MIIPKFWAEARQQVYSKLRRRKLTIKRFGWSDESLKAAQRLANERLAKAVQDVLAGTRIKNRERAVAYNGEGLPIREEIVKKVGQAVITRNLYGALCLNVPNILFGDIDFKRNVYYAFPFLFSVLLLFLGAEIIAESYFPITYSGLNVGRILFFLWLVGIIQLIQFLTKHGYKSKSGFSPKNRLRLEKQALGLIEAFLKKNPEWHLRTYRTPNGLRLLAMHSPFSPNDPAVADFFKQLKIDSTYSRMCLNQQCFRARLTPKPWRIGIKTPIPPARGVWPVPADTLSARKKWIEEYEVIAPKFAACKFLKTLGSSKTDPSALEIQRLHDKECSAERDLPLA